MRKPIMRNSVKVRQKEPRRGFRPGLTQTGLNGKRFELRI